MIPKPTEEETNFNSPERVFCVEKQKEDGDYEVHSLTVS